MNYLKKTLRLFGLYITLVLVTIQYSYAGAGSNTFADWLYKNGHYENARHEYLRILHENESTNSELSPKLYTKIAQSYLLSEKYIRGVSWCEKIERKIPESDVSDILLIHANMLMKMDYSLP